MLKLAYHVSESSNRDSILKIGLLPNIKKDIHIKRKPAIYFFDNFEDAKEWSYWSSIHYKTSFDIFYFPFPTDFIKDIHPDMSDFSSFLSDFPIKPHLICLFHIDKI